jgi:hypothetical protein
VSDVRPRDLAARPVCVDARLAARLAALGSSLAAAACTASGGAGPAAGFATAYEVASADGGAAPGFRGVRGSGAGDGWAVGEGGTAVELLGGRWFPVTTGSTATLGGLAALDVGHAYAVELGGARVLAWAGRGWSPLGADRADRAAAATFALAPNDVWVAGDGVEHWDGQAWSQQIASGTAFTALSGSFDTDVWAVGPTGAQHDNGHGWAPVTVPVSQPLAGVWSSGIADAWLVGAQGTVLHWNGGGLTALVTGTTKDLTCVAGTGPTDVWVGGQDGLLLHWDGTQWTQVVTPAMRTIDDLWTALGGDGNVLFVDDTGVVSSYQP